MGKQGKRRAVDVSDEQIVNAYNESHSVYKTERQLGVSATTIYRVLERHGVQRVGLQEYRARSARFSLARSSNIRSEYEAGASFADLVVQYGGTPYSIRTAIQRAGGTLIPVCPAASPKEDVRIVKLYAKGLSQMKISLALGRSQSFVSRTLRRSGVRPFFRVGSNHGMWTGGRIFDDNGYVRVRIDADDPMATMRLHDGYVMEHRLVMARKLGRALLRSETVHHIDGDKQNNAESNLQLRHGKHGKGVVLCCRDCGSRNIGPLEIHEEHHVENR